MPHATMNMDIDDDEDLFGDNEGALDQLDPPENGEMNVAEEEAVVVADEEIDRKSVV